MVMTNCPVSLRTKVKWPEFSLQLLHCESNTVTTVPSCHTIGVRTEHLRCFPRIFQDPLRCVFHVLHVEVLFF